MAENCNERIISAHTAHPRRTACMPMLLKPDSADSSSTASTQSQSEIMSQPPYGWPDTGTRVNASYAQGRSQYPTQPPTSSGPAGWSDSRSPPPGPHFAQRSPPYSFAPSPHSTHTYCPPNFVPPTGTPYSGATPYDPINSPQGSFPGQSAAWGGYQNMPMAVNAWRYTGYRSNSSAPQHAKQAPSFAGVNYGSSPEYMGEW